ncbi:CAAX prenyl protease-like protein [Dyadobacter jejuensis]|uniref:CAAX prenyl protease-like protein n=1 Tax=Dyadobacter jejuensis TaxID=1082580 RepID=A0A316A6Q0_9BACT|nr:CPBP family glutamic-type intramembrane protease [Dyadobacter jejuensis]PWJ53385.1 CAAX prenyl protease-like protein [Dyadobacter jejuensis]
MIQDIITFYRNPYACFLAGSGESIKERIVALRKTYFFCLYIAVMIILVIAILDGILTNTCNISIYENLRKMRDEFSATNSRLSSFVQTCLIAPFIEESLFRLPLLTKSRLLRWVVFFVLVQYFFPLPFLLEVSFWWYNVILILIFAGIIILNNASESNSTPIFDPKKYNYLCWALTIAFALVHINNFAPLHLSVFYLYPIYLLPQFVYGVVLSYLAIRYNSIVWPFILHVAINSTAEVPKLLTYLF